MSVTAKRVTQAGQKNTDYSVMNFEHERGVLRVRIVEGHSRFVHDIAEFLNADLDNIPSADSQENLPWILSGIGASETSKRQGKKLQKELKDDILSLSEGRKQRTRGLPEKLRAAFIDPSDRGAAYPLLRLLKKIKGMRLTLSPGAQSWAPSMRSRKALRLGAKKFIVNDDVAYRSFRQEIYWYLYLGLRSGDFNILKNCRNCGKFFVCYFRRQQFCSSTCKNLFHNRSRLQSNYFLKRRQEIRRKQLRKAQEILEAGGDVALAIRRSRLSFRILQKEGFINKYTECVSAKRPHF